MKRDVLLGAVVGFLTGIFTLVIFSYLEIDFGYKNVFIPFGLAVLWSAGVGLGYFLARFFPFYRQFGKFATVGFLSASIDFAVLNIVSGLTGVTTGNVVGLVNVPGFAIAVVNGYLWNKLWVFPVRGSPPEAGATSNGVFADFPKFLFVTVSGLLINSFIVVVLTTYIPLSGPFTSAQWLNISKVFANAVGLIWNFVGYKFVVFVSKK